MMQGRISGHLGKRAVSAGGGGVLGPGGLKNNNNNRWRLMENQQRQQQQQQQQSLEADGKSVLRNARFPFSPLRIIQLKNIFNHRYKMIKQILISA